MVASRINDQVFEALFRQAVIDNFHEELDSLPPDEELARLYTFTPAHEARMQRLFTREARRERSQLLFKWSKRVAAVFLIAVTVLFCALMIVPEARAVITETIIEWYEQFVRFTSNATEVERTGHEPTYIPSGFNETARDEGEMTKTIIYGNDEGRTIIFLCGSESASTAVDSENRTHDTILSDGIEYHLLTPIDGNGEATIVWSMDGQRYAVASDISTDELLRIANSVG